MDTTNIENAVPVPEESVVYKVSSSGAEQSANMVVSTAKNEDAPRIVTPSSETQATMKEGSADETAGTSSDGDARHVTVVDDDVVFNNKVTVAGDSRFHRVFAGSCNLVEDVNVSLKNLIDKKVDKKEGYGLSQNDFTDALKTKLVGLRQFSGGNIGGGGYSGDGEGVVDVVVLGGGNVVSDASIEENGQVLALHRNVKAIRKDMDDDNDGHKLTVGELEVLRNMLVKGTLTTQTLNVLGKAVFANLEINKTSYTAGDIIQGCGSGTIERIEYYKNYGAAAVPCAEDEAETARCYLKVDDGETAVQNTLHEGDLIRSQTFNIKAGVYENVQNSYWWRLCRASGEDWVDIDLGETDEVRGTGSDKPKVGDVMVQMGNVSDTTRMNGIMYIVNGTHGDGIEGFAPAIIQYSGLNKFRLTKRNVPTCISPVKSWFSGEFSTMSGTGIRIPARVFMGDWSPSAHPTYMQEWRYNGNIWLCIYTEEDEDGNYIPTTDVPSFESEHWQWIGGVGNVPLRMEIDLGGDALLGNRETKTIVCRVCYGWDDITDRVASWTVKRNTDDIASDLPWDNAHKSFDGTLTITQSDLAPLGRNNDKTTFIFSAMIDVENIETKVEAQLDIE